VSVLRDEQDCYHDEAEVIILAERAFSSEVVNTMTFENFTRLSLTLTRSPKDRWDERPNVSEGVRLQPVPTASGSRNSLDFMCHQVAIVAAPAADEYAA